MNIRFEPKMKCAYPHFASVSPSPIHSLPILLPSGLPPIHSYIPPSPSSPPLSPPSGINRPTGGSGNKAGILNEVRSQYINKCGDSSPGPLDLSPWSLDSLPSSCLLTSEAGVWECGISGWGDFHWILEMRCTILYMANGRQVTQSCKILIMTSISEFLGGILALYSQLYFGWDVGLKGQCHEIPSSRIMEGQRFQPLDPLLGIYSDLRSPFVIDSWSLDPLHGTLRDPLTIARTHWFIYGFFLPPVASVDLQLSVYPLDSASIWPLWIYRLPS